MIFVDCGALDNCKNPMESFGEICVCCNQCGRFDKKEIKIKSGEIQTKDKTLNLCDTCKFEIPSCKATEEGVDFKFGHGLGNDNVYECKIYESESKEI